MNTYRDSSVGSEMNVQCPDSKVYSMPLLLMPARCCFGRVDRNPLLPRLPILLAPPSPLSVSRQSPPLRRCAAASAAAAPFHNPPRPPWWPQGLSLPRASLRRCAGKAGPLGHYAAAVLKRRLGRRPGLCPRAGPCPGPAPGPGQGPCSGTAPHTPPPCMPPQARRGNRHCA